MDSSDQQPQDIPVGAQKIQMFRNGGASDDQIQAWKSEKADMFRRGGATADQIRQYFGDKEPDMSGVKSQIDENLKKNGAPPQFGQPGPIAAKDLWDAAKAGFESSDTGLFFRGKMPDVEVGKDAGTLQHVVSGAAQMIGDLPAMLAGGAAATELGPVGMAAGAGAASEGIRRALIEQYQNPNGVRTAGDFLDRSLKILTDSAKGAASMAALEVVGGNMKVVNAFGSPLQKALTGTTARIAAEAAAQSTVSSALNGHLPEFNDFLNGAIAIGGLHAIGFAVNAARGVNEPADYVARKMQNIYKNTGANPAEIVETAHNDPTFKGELLSQDPEVPKEASGPNPPPPPEDQEKPESGSDNLPAIIPPKEEASDTNPGASDARDEILSRVGKQAEPPKETTAKTIMKTIDSAMANGLDYTSAVKQQLDKMGVDNPENAHKLMRLFAAVNDKVQSFLEWGTRNFDTGETNGESLMSILNEYKEKTGDNELLNFKAYGIAARTVELGNRGKSLWGTEAPDELGRKDAQSVDREFLLNNQHIKPYFDRFVSFGNRVLDYVGDSGRYSDDSIEAMKDLNQRHISFKRVLEPDPLTGEVPFNAKGIKKIGDSDLKLQDPLLSRLQDLRNLIRLAHETKAHNTYIEDMLGDDLQKHLDGKDIESDTTQGPDPLLRRSEEQRGPMSKNQIAYWQDGKRTLFDVPKEIADSLKRMSGNDQAISIWTKLLRPFAGALRIGTIDNPLFALRHTWRNQLTAPTLSQTGLKMFQAFSYLPEFLGGSDRVRNFFYDGGAVSSLKNLTDGYLDGKIYELNKGAPILQKAWNLTKTAFDFSHMLIVNHDNMVRFAEYSRMLDKGASRVESAFAAREVLPDFQKEGLQRSALLQTTAFLNVHLQGVTRMGQAVGKDMSVIHGALRGEIDPIDAMKQLGTGYIAKNLAYITVPSVLLSLAQRNDDTLKDVPDWQKYNYWLYHASNWRDANSLAEAMSVKSAYPSNYRQLPDGTHQVNDGTIYRIQKPFTNGIMFGSGVEAALDSFQKHSPQAFEDYAKAITKSLIPEALPTAVQPVFEQAANRNMYTNTSLVRQSMENKLPEAQYDRYTSETAKGLGKILSYVPLVKDIGPNDAKLSSPVVLDNYIHSWGGTLGYYAVNLLDVGLRKAGIAPDPVKPVSQLADIPFVKEFVIRFPNARPQGVEDFLERYKKSDEVFNTAKSMYKDGDRLGASQLIERYHLNMDRLVGIDKAIQNLNSNIQKVYQYPEDGNEGMGAVQKRQLIDMMMYKITSFAKEGNRRMDAFEGK